MGSLEDRIIEAFQEAMDQGMKQLNTQSLAVLVKTNESNLKKKLRKLEDEGRVEKRQKRIINFWGLNGE